MKNHKDLKISIFCTTAFCLGKVDASFDLRQVLPGAYMEVAVDHSAAEIARQAWGPLDAPLVSGP